MKQRWHRTRQIVTVTLLCLATLGAGATTAVAVTSRPTNASVAQSARTSPALACRPVHIRVGLGPPVSAATGEHAFILTFTNEGMLPCYLEGYVQPDLVAASGAILHLTRVRVDQYVTHARPRRVLLGTHRSAYVEVAKYRCDLRDELTAASVRFNLSLLGHSWLFEVALGKYLDMSVCQGGPSDPGNSFAVTPFEATLRALTPG